MKRLDGVRLDLSHTTGGVTNDAVKEDLFFDLNIATHDSDDRKSLKADGNIGVNATFGFSLLSEPILKLMQNRSDKLVRESFLLSIEICDNEFANGSEQLSAKVFSN